MLWWIAPSERSWNDEKDIGHQKARFAEYAVYPVGAVCYQFWRGMANGTRGGCFRKVSFAGCGSAWGAAKFLAKPASIDAYLWQTVENKQKFISQIMTSKSPVRSCDDVDETALSFAEIKALCAGDPRIKERMDLDVEVSRLKLMKADHQSKQYRLEDQLLKYFPEEIEKHKGFIKGFESDLEVLAAHPHPEDGFVGMEIRGDLLTDKENAGAALLDACKEVKTSDPVQIGSYRGYAISVEFSAWKQEYTLLLKGQIHQKMQQYGTENLSAYLRKMALDGYVVKLELPELKELVSLMRRSSNNLNQLTRKVHETGRVYNADLEDISQRQEQLWEGVKEILTQLSKLS